MVSYNDFYVRVGTHETNECRRASVWICIRGGVDLLIQHLQASSLKRIDNPNSTLPAVTALSLKAPDKYFIASRNTRTSRCLSTQSIACVIVRRADITKPIRPIRSLAVTQRGIECRKNYALIISLLDNRASGLLARKPVGSNSVNTGRDRLLDLLEHQVWIPI